MAGVNFLLYLRQIRSRFPLKNYHQVLKHPLFVSAQVLFPMLILIVYASYCHWTGTWCDETSQANNLVISSCLCNKTTRREKRIMASITISSFLILTDGLSLLKVVAWADPLTVAFNDTPSRLSWIDLPTHSASSQLTLSSAINSEYKACNWCRSGMNGLWLWY